MTRDSIVFYRSFYDAIKELPEEQQVACFHAIMDYALDGKEPEGNGIEKTVFTLVRPQIDTNNQRYDNGSKGGRPRNKSAENETQRKADGTPSETEVEPNQNQERTKEEPKENQTGTKPEPNVYVNDNVNVNENVKTEREARACARGEHQTETVTGIPGDGTSEVPMRGIQFPAFWSVYPKQVEQQMAQQEYLSLLMSTPGLEEEALIQAAKNYAEACQIQRKAKKYIKNPANWISDGVWMDYMPDKYQRPETEEGKEARIPVNNRFNLFPQRAYSQADYQSMEQRLLQQAGDG